MSLWSISNLLLPLLGGFLFCIFYPRVRFLLSGDSGQRLIFASATVGVILSIISYFLASLESLHIGTWATHPLHYLSFIKAHFFSSEPFKTPDIISLFLGPAIGGILSLLDNKQSALTKALQLRGDRLECLLDRAWSARLPVMLTLKSGKVYVGLLKDTVVTYRGLTHLELLPAFSGYREPLDSSTILHHKLEPKRVTFNVIYHELLGWLPEAGGKNNDALVKNDKLTIKTNEMEFTVDTQDIGVVVSFDDIE